MKKSKSWPNLHSLEDLPPSKPDSGKKVKDKKMSSKDLLAHYSIKLFDSNFDSLQLPFLNQKYFNNKNILTNGIDSIVITCSFDTFHQYFIYNEENNTCDNLTLTKIKDESKQDCQAIILLDGQNNRVDQFDLHINFPALDPGDYDLEIKSPDADNVDLIIYITVNYEGIEPPKIRRTDDQIVKSNYHDIECSICLDLLIQPNKKLVSLQAMIADPNNPNIEKNVCGHVFHLDCIEDYISSTCNDYSKLSLLKCPNCRQYSIPLSINI